MIKNFALLTYSGEGMSIAKKFQDAGVGEVMVGMIEDTADMFLPQEIRAMKLDGKDPSEEEGQKNRFALYDGILNVVSADSLIAYLKDRDDKDEWFVFTDMNYCFKYAEQAAAFMPNGNFPTAEHRKLEVDREYAKQFIKKNYPDVAKQKYWEFPTVEQAKSFVEQTDELLVLKGDGVDAPTVVPPTNDLEACKAVLLDMLDKNADKYNAGGMIFEVKLDDAVELTPERVFYNGKELYTTLDIETKRKYAGDVGGELVGCGTDMILITNHDDKINQVAFPPIVQKMAEEAKGLFIWDLSLLISRESGKMYPGEFCANRFGWNAFMTEMEGLDVVKFFNDIVDGSNPMPEHRVSTSLRVFNDDLSEKSKDQIKIIFPDEIAPHVWLIDAKMKDGELYTSGYMADVGVLTANGEDVTSSIETLYEYMSKFILSTKKWGYRCKGDYYDMTYHTAIMNRYNYAVQKGLVTGYEPYTAAKDKTVAELEMKHSNDLDALKSSFARRLEYLINSDE